jgi:hypothetical protein
MDRGRAPLERQEECDTGPRERFGTVDCTPHLADSKTCPVLDKTEPLDRELLHHGLDPLEASLDICSTSRTCTEAKCRIIYFVYKDAEAHDHD